MTPIPAENIMRRADGLPECLEFGVLALSTEVPVALIAFGSAMSPEERAERIADLRAKLEAVSTLSGVEVPAHIAEALEHLEAEDDTMHRAIVGDAFEICFN